MFATWNVGSNNTQRLEKFYHLSYEQDEQAVQNALRASANRWLCSINAICPPPLMVTSSAIGNSAFMRSPHKSGFFGASLAKIFSLLKVANT